jgi:hypothetical protein
MLEPDALNRRTSGSEGRGCWRQHLLTRLSQGRDDLRRGLTELLSPDIFPIEVAHALARAERRGIVPPTEAWPKLGDVKPGRG